MKTGSFSFWGSTIPVASVTWGWDGRNQLVTICKLQGGIQILTWYFTDISLSVFHALLRLTDIWPGEVTATLRRIQRIFRGHVDVTVVDVAQHGLEGLLARYHLADGDVDLSVHGHEGAKHGLKVTLGAKTLELKMWNRWQAKKLPLIILTWRTFLNNYHSFTSLIKFFKLHKHLTSGQCLPGPCCQYGFVSRSRVPI